MTVHGCATRQQAMQQRMKWTDSQTAAVQGGRAVLDRRARTRGPVLGTPKRYSPRSLAWRANNPAFSSSDTCTSVTLWGCALAAGAAPASLRAGRLAAETPSAALRLGAGALPLPASWSFDAAPRPAAAAPASCVTGAAALAAGGASVRAVAAMPFRLTGRSTRRRGGAALPLRSSATIGVLVAGCSGSAAGAAACIAAAAVAAGSGCASNARSCRCGTYT